MNPFLDGWAAVVKNLGLHSVLHCVIHGPFNNSYVLEVAGHALASSLLEVSSLLALLVLLRVLVQSLLVLLTLPSENNLPATLSLLGVRAVMVRSSVLRVDGGRLAGGA